MQKAAEELRKQMSPEAQEALRRMAQQMGQMENEIKKLGNGQRMQVQIAQLKEVFRRAGQQGNNGQPQNGEGSGTNLARNGQPQNGQGQNGQNGKGGKNGKSGTMLKDFNDRAKGDQKNQVLLLDENDGNGQSVILPIPMGPGDKPGQQGNGQELPQRVGEGIGDQHDPNLMGDKTKLASKRNESRVDGNKGAGPSKSETILGSAERGFASSDYKKVYADYSSVVEEVLSKERIPPGYRYYVKRYFQLIRPREGP
jgi:hypothetical protein